LKGRTPSAYIAVLIIKFFGEHGHEKFTRKLIDYVEYITSNGETSELEQLVRNHPLMLRIVGVRMTNYAPSGKPNCVDILLRSPISPAELSNFQGDEEAFSKEYENRLMEFAKWVEAQETGSATFMLKSGEEIPIHYRPDWMKFLDEQGYEWMSNLSGELRISFGAQLLLYAELGASAPDIPQGLDIYLHLNRLFEGTEAEPAPKELTFDNYWPRIIEGEHRLAEIFFGHLERFPEEVRSNLEKVFKKFAEQHADWVKKAKADSKAIKEFGDGFIPTPGDVFHYKRVFEAFFTTIKPALQSCWPAFAKAALGILGTERERARQHWEKMRQIFG
jgi:hypothetical protein